LLTGHFRLRLRQIEPEDGRVVDDFLESLKIFEFFKFFFLNSRVPYLLSSKIVDRHKMRRE